MINIGRRILRRPSLKIMQSDPVLALNGLTKSFGEINAVKDVSLVLKNGEVLALLGENGAGKTTLMNMLFGHYLPDEGSVEIFDFNGKKQQLSLGNPRSAIAAGIGMVHQHFTLAENLTALDNIMLGSEPLFNFSRKQALARGNIENIMSQSGLKVPLDIPVGQLTVGEQQRIEILKALYRDVRILVLDEPTAVLTPQEADVLFQNIGVMTQNGLSVIFISHKLREVLAFSHRLAVLRHGEKVGEMATSDANEQKIVSLMVGSQAKSKERKYVAPGNVVLSLEDLSVPGRSRRESLDAINLTVRKHEVLGIAGISGNGQTALAGAISGMIEPSSGQLILDGKTIIPGDPSITIEEGIARIPEDRHRDGIVGQMSVAENLVIENISSSTFQRHGILNWDAILERSKEICVQYDVRGPGINTEARLLSGGNIQKLILARVFESRPKLILANQPTRGLDIGAANAVAERLLVSRKKGVAIVLISEDLDEIINLSDRIMVMRDGNLSHAETFDRDTLGLLMAGEAT